MLTHLCVCGLGGKALLSEVGTESFSERKQCCFRNSTLRVCPAGEQASGFGRGRLRGELLGGEIAPRREAWLLVPSSPYSSNFFLKSPSVLTGHMTSQNKGCQSSPSLQPALTCFPRSDQCTEWKYKGIWWDTPSLRRGVSYPPLFLIASCAL